MNEKNHFEYTYSASKEEEIKKIRDKYIPKEESQMDLLLRMDAGVTSKATMYAIIIGTISSLILGVGMCFCMVWDHFLWGILIGLIGIAGIIAAYPVYAHIIKKEREKIAPEILKLTEELLK